MLDQSIVFTVLVVALLLFISGRWPFEIVALVALLVLVLADIVPPGEAFLGFGNPAVVTVAAMLVISRSLYNSGVADIIARWVSRVGNDVTLQVAALTGIVAVCSAFMNNVGALALLMPVAIQMARKSGYPPSLFLMPLAFGSLLGGMTTLIGTPPNIIISSFRADTGEAAFRMFDFTAVGVGVTLAGILFMALVGWRLIPQRRGPSARTRLLDIEDYISEVRVPEDSKMVGKFVHNLEAATNADVTVVGLVRGEALYPAPSSFEIIAVGDVLVVEANPEDLKTLVDTNGFEFVGEEDLAADVEDILGSDEVRLAEAVVMRDSPIEGRTARSLDLHAHYELNLLAVARQGATIRERLGSIEFRAGDVLLLQGRAETLQEMLPVLGCLPLRQRDLRLSQPRRVFLSVGIFGIALILAATDVLAIQTAVVGAAVIMVLTNLITIRQVYESIDWRILVLLGAMIPVGQALESTGSSNLIADRLVDVAGDIPAWATLALVIVGTSLLTDVVNNAAAAIIMAPVGISVAAGFGASADPFLMGVAIGASSAFLTPIGHQSNILVMGPGGYRFGDYWRLGLPIKAITVAVAVPLIMWAWPLGIAAQ